MKCSICGREEVALLKVGHSEPVCSGCLPDLVTKWPETIPLKKNFWCKIGWHDWEFGTQHYPHAYRCKQCGEFKGRIAA